MGLNVPQQTDEEIARLVQSGNIDLFGEIVNRYEEKIKRYGRKFLSGVEDIEDIVQDVFIKVYENIQSFDIKRKFSPWIYRIAHNEFVNALKKHKRKPLPLLELDTLFPYSSSKEIEDDKDKEANIENINKCLNKLEPKYREPVILYFLEELSYKEIAAILHIPSSTVGVRLKRAKEKIKNICKEKNG